MARVREKAGGDPAKRQEADGPHRSPVGHCQPVTLTWSETGALSFPSNVRQCSGQRGDVV